MIYEREGGGVGTEGETARDPCFKFYCFPLNFPDPPEDTYSDPSAQRKEGTMGLLSAFITEIASQNLSGAWLLEAQWPG